MDIPKRSRAAKREGRGAYCISPLVGQFVRTEEPSRVFKKVPKQIYFKGPDLGIIRGPRKAPLLPKIKVNKSIPQ